MGAPPKPRSEAELIARCLRGEVEAWNEVFDRHYAEAGRVVFQLGYQFSQEAFLSVIKHLPTFQGQCQFQTWIFRIPANKAKDYREGLQAAKRGGEAVTVSIHQEDPEQMP